MSSQAQGPESGHLQEKNINRNPHPDFAKVEASRPAWTEREEFSFTKTRKADWKFGDGATDGGEGLKKKHREIDPHEPGRPPVWNYKLLISGIVPRPIALLSTVNAEGKTNLAPFSYFQIVGHDPPIFTVSFSGSGGLAKDSLKNVLATKECVINIISEHYIEAANASAINAPHGITEWALSGLHPAPTSIVKPARIQEAVFSIEAKLVDSREFESRSKPGVKSNVLVILEGVRFWAREDAINEEGTLLDPAVLAPVSRFGGITYGRTTEGFELLRYDWEKEVKEGNVPEGLITGKVEGQ